MSQTRNVSVWRAASKFQRRSQYQRRPGLEPLEDRCLLSASAVGDDSLTPALVTTATAKPCYVIYHRSGVPTSPPNGASTPSGYTPTQIMQAYGINLITNQGIAEKWHWRDNCHCRCLR